MFLNVLHLTSVVIFIKAYLNLNGIEFLYPIQPLMVLISCYLQYLCNKINNSIFKFYKVTIENLTNELGLNIIGTHTKDNHLTSWGESIFYLLFHFNKLL